MINRLSRRSALALAGGLMVPAWVAGPFAGSALAAGDPYALAPKYTAGWRAEKTSKLATVTQIARGVRIVTPDKAAQLDPGQLALWATTPVVGDFRFSFTYRVLARVATPAGAFGTFYFDTEGQGTAKYPKLMSSWTGITPGDPVYALHARGLRFSFATYNPANPDIHNKLRLRYFEFNSTTQLVGEASPQVFPFTNKVAYLVVVTRQGTTLHVDVTPAAGGATEAYEWTDDRIGKWGAGSIGFRWRAQDCEVTDAALVHL